jgi:ABC-2 type transport system ATP-binding protein
MVGVWPVGGASSDPVTTSMTRSIRRQTAPSGDLDRPVMERRAVSSLGGEHHLEEADAMTAAIATSELVKTFGPTRALDHIDLTVETGEVHGFLGPNGAGKSTTIRVLLGLLRADSGRVEVLGGDPWRDAVALHRRMAYVPGDVELWPNLTGGEAIDLLGRLRGGLDPARRADLIERFDLDPTKKGRTYSKGNRQKVAIVAALASDAELLLLDEPTAGLDPLMEVVFQDVITQVKAEGRTVLLSSHILAQVEKLADRVSIIRQGEIVQSGTLAAMRHLTRTTIEAETRQPVAGLERMPGIHDLEATDGRVRFAVDGDRLDEAVRMLGRFEIRSLVSHPPTLEELMLRHYGGQLAADGNGHRQTVDMGDQQ